MFRKYILPLLAIGGIALGCIAAMRSARVTPAAPPVSEAPRPPFKSFVAGAGIVETSSENIAIGTQLPGIVSQIYVHVGSEVKTGDPLFTIDDRAQRSLVRSREAAVKVAEAELSDAQYELKLAEASAQFQVITIEQRDRDRFTVQKAEAQLSQAQADLKSAETDLDRLTVCAPVDGEVMQLKVHLGEFAPTGVLDQPLILFGCTKPLHVRADVDENDAWRVRLGAPAVGFVRGNKDLKTALEFVRFEPYVIPKKSLTGESSERVDTRVLQVIYHFERGNLPLFVGQQMDVFINAEQAEPTIPARTNDQTLRISQMR
jgi:RND family efflux transporter MFP subunit